MNVSTISGRAEGYGMPGVTIDGTDILAVHEATSVAYVRACSGQGPTLIEAMVERYLPHTSDDDDSRYRSKKEIEESQKRDPLKLLGDYLANTGALSQDLRQEFFDKARKEVDQATELAEQMPYPNTNHFLDHVYSGDHL
jgi:2-oxoisovalerate dehydrogenase E1 component alpha subunit